MTNPHPITPPPELRRQWLDNDHFLFATGTNDLLAITRDRLDSVINQCAAWAADQELEACCQWLTSEYDDRGFAQALRLRCDRRPDPPTLKEQAIAALNEIEDHMLGPTTQEKLIRRALEALDD
jgi:hypothetical protein